MTLQPVLDRDVHAEAADLRVVIETRALIDDTDLSLPELMQTVAERTRELTGAAGAVVELAEGDELVHRAVSGSAAGTLGLRLSRDASLSGLCLSLGRVLRCGDAEVDPRVDRDACRRTGVRSMLVAPLTHRGATIGVLEALSPFPDAFGDRDVESLRLLAGSVAASLSHARRLEELSRRNEALDDFSAHVAHDLGNPITAVMLAGACLREMLVDGFPEAAELAHMIEQQAVQSAELIDGLLALARSGRTPRRDDFDLGQVVDEAARGIAGITLENLCAGVRLVADRVAVRQAVANLLSNGARYAAGTEAAEMTVRCEESPEGWRVLVADRGPGLERSDLRRVFAAFERGHGSSDVDGSGLGLAIVAAMAKAHGGETGYEPRPGGGSVFWFSLLRGD